MEPSDVSELKAMEVDLPRLDDDSESSCPVAVSEVVEYLRREGEKVAAPLRFVRTAVIEDRHYWIWEFEGWADHCYATVSIGSSGSRTMGYEEDFGLTPDQFVLGDYHRLF